MNLKNESGQDKVTILCGNYKDVDKYITQKTLVYMDPPYRPITESGFTAYNKGGFNDDSQVELANFFKQISDRGAYSMLSNSDPKNFDENDEFFDELYSDFNIDRVYASRMINSK